MKNIRKMHLCLIIFCDVKNHDANWAKIFKISTQKPEEDPPNMPSIELYLCPIVSGMHESQSSSSAHWSIKYKNQRIWFREQNSIICYDIASKSSSPYPRIKYYSGYQLVNWEGWKNPFWIPTPIDKDLFLSWFFASVHSRDSQRLVK